MNKTFQALIGLAVVGSLAACDDFLVTEPQTIITDEQVWSNTALITNVLANFYDRIPINQGLPNGNFEDFAQLDEGVWSGVTAGASSTKARPTTCSSARCSRPTRTALPFRPI